MISSKIGYFRLVAQLLGSTVKTLLRPSAATFDSVIVQIGSIGVGAIPAASLIAVTAGFVLALVLELQLSQIGKVEIVPSLLWIILTEQVVPVGVALIFAGRSVSAVTAELGSMQVSEEVKALFTMGIDVVPYLLVPRFLGFQIMLPVVTLVGHLRLLDRWLVTLRPGAKNEHSRLHLLCLRRGEFLECFGGDDKECAFRLSGRHDRFLQGD